MPRYTLILSGKGGVGKTITAINIAYRIAREEGSAGLLDSDFANPSVFDMLNIDEQVEVTENREIIPVEVDGVKVVSMPLLVDKPVSMKGAMYAEMLKDIALYTRWDCNNVIIDMPAGVGDHFIKAVEILLNDIVGVVIVYIPAHIMSAVRIINVCKNYDIPVLGVIENMSGYSYKCEKCGNEIVFKPFGEERVSELDNVKVIGSIPFSFDVYKAVASKKPFLEGDIFKPFDDITKIILASPTISKSVVEKIKERMKGIIRDTLLDIMAFIFETINREVDIEGIQDEFKLPGGSIVRLDIMDSDMNKVKISEHFKVERGVIKYVVNPSRVDAVIRIWDRALLWSILGYRTDLKEPYDLADAFASGKAEFYGLGSYRGLPMALHFFRNIWGKLRATKTFSSKIRPVLERIA